MLNGDYNIRKDFWFIWIFFPTVLNFSEERLRKSRSRFCVPLDRWDIEVYCNQSFSKDILKKCSIRPSKVVEKFRPWRRGSKVNFQCGMKNMRILYKRVFEKQTCNIILETFCSYRVFYRSVTYFYLKFCWVDKASSWINKQHSALSD